jgi:hypothetical protein
MLKDQEVTAVRVANLPAEEFEAPSRGKPAALSLRASSLAQVIGVHSGERWDRRLSPIPLPSEVS